LILGDGHFYEEQLFAGEKRRKQIIRAFPPIFDSWLRPFFIGANSASLRRRPQSIIKLIKGFRLTVILLIGSGLRRSDDIFGAFAGAMLKLL